MGQLKFKKIYNEELKILIKKMDKRHKHYMMLEDFKFKHGQIPDKYSPDWTAWLTDGRKHWRKVPGVWKRIKKAAKAAAKNRVENAQ